MTSEGLVVTRQQLIQALTIGFLEDETSEEIVDILERFGLLVVRKSVLLKNAKTMPQLTKELKCRHLWYVCRDCTAKCEFEGTNDFEGKCIRVPDALIEEAKKP